MFNFHLCISIIAAMCECLNHSHLRAGEPLPSPSAILKCNVTIYPENRNVRSQRALSERESIYIKGLLDTACNDKYILVCCEYFIQTADGRTLGILMDDEQESANGFDLGVKMNAIETHAERFHKVRIIQNAEDRKRLYSFVHELFQD